jgi:hypothetical protein
MNLGEFETILKSNIVEIKASKKMMTKTKVAIVDFENLKFSGKNFIHKFTTAYYDVSSFGAISSVYVS